MNIIIFGSGPSEVDEFIIDNLVSFRRNISTDISDNGNRMFSLGYVNKNLICIMKTIIRLICIWLKG